MQIKNKRTISRWKEISKVKCIPNNKKINKMDKANLNQLMNRWVMWMKNKKNKI